MAVARPSTHGVYSSLGYCDESITPAALCFSHDCYSGVKTCLAVSSKASYHFHVHEIVMNNARGVLLLRKYLIDSYFLAKNKREEDGRDK